MALVFVPRIMLYGEISPMPRTTDELMLTKMDQVLRILAVMATKDMRQREQIALLDRAGLQPKDIADLLGTSSNTVRVELVGLRKSKRPRGPKKTSAAEK